MFTNNTCIPFCLGVDYLSVEDLKASDCEGKLDVDHWKYTGGHVRKCYWHVQTVRCSHSDQAVPLHKLIPGHTQPDIWTLSNLLIFSISLYFFIYLTSFFLAFIFFFITSRSFFLFVTVYTEKANEVLIHSPPSSMWEEHTLNEPTAKLTNSWCHFHCTVCRLMCDLRVSLSACMCIYHLLVLVQAIAVFAFRSLYFGMLMNIQH